MVEQPDVGELEGESGATTKWNSHTHTDSGEKPSRSGQNATWSNPLPRGRAELPAHPPYMHPVELFAAGPAGLDAEVVVTNERMADVDMNIETVPSQTSLPQPSPQNNDVSTERTANTTTIDPSVLLAASSSNDLHALIQRHAQLEVRKQRMLDIQKLEAEQAEIEDQLRAAAQSRLSQAVMNPGEMDSKSGI